jgi:hypothetical protein
MSNNYSVVELNHVRFQIEKLSKFNQVEILRMLSQYKNVIINENKYGIHINLSELSDDVLNELSNYVKYVNSQESYLNNAEKEKENYKNTFFLHNKDMSV